jgi:hypothetical protein
MHVILKPVVFFSVLALFMGGCSSGNQSSVKKGDKLVVQEDLPRENAETQWADSYTDGFTSAIPKGTVLEVLYTPNSSGNIIEVKPVEVQGNKDAESVEAFFVPEQIRTKEGYKDYAFSIKKDYIGSKVTISK